MSDQDTDQPDKKPRKRAKDAFAPGKAGEKQALFTAKEMDIYCNKVTKETFICHSKTIDYKNLDFLEYDPEEYSVDVHMKDGRVLDLGVKIQWLVRPYFANAEIIQIVQTKNREPIDGTFVPLKHKGQK